MHRRESIHSWIIVAASSFIFFLNGSLFYTQGWYLIKISAFTFVVQEQISNLVPHDRKMGLCRLFSINFIITVRNSSGGKVMFSQASAILSTGGSVPLGRHPLAGRHLPGQADTPLGRHPLTRQTPPGTHTHPGQTPPCSDTPLGRPPWSGRHPPGQADTPLDRPTPQPGRNPPPPPRADCHCSGRCASY